MVYHSKNKIANVFNLTIFVNTKFSSHIAHKFMCSCCNATYYGQTQRYFLWELLSTFLLHLWLVNLSKRPRKLQFLMLLDVHKESVYNFPTAFNLKLKDFLLISCNKPILNKIIYSFLFEQIDWLIIFYRLIII